MDDELWKELYPWADMGNPKVKKFWGERNLLDKRFKKWVNAMIALYALLFILVLLNKLSVELLFVATFFSFVFLFWFVNNEQRDLNNRIEIEKDIIFREIQKIHNKIK